MLGRCRTCQNGHEQCHLALLVKFVVVVVDFYFASQGQTGNGAQFYGSEFQKGENYGERERERQRERERGRKEGDDKQLCSVNRAILQCQ